MGAPESCEDVKAWQRARELTRKIYALCRRQNLARDFGLCSQLQRASVSIMNNLAEGWESIHRAEKKQAYNDARRSCGEVRSMTCVLLDSEFISPDEQKDLLGCYLHCGRLITGLIRSVNGRP